MLFSQSARVTIATLSGNHAEPYQAAIDLIFVAFSKIATVADTMEYHLVQQMTGKSENGRK